MTEYRDTILQRSEIFLPDPHAGPPYPGLGLPLQGRVPFGAVCYPSVASDKSAILSVPLPVRELAMMNIMDRLTDKTDWNIKVFDEEIVAKWRAEAKAIPDIEFWKISIKDKSVNYGGEYVEERYIKECKLEGIVNDNTFDVVIQELRSKAKFFEKTSLIPTLDAQDSVVKSDKVVSNELHEEIRAAFDTLVANQSEAPDWHPKSNDTVMDLVHPSMYPLVYDRSKGFEEEMSNVDEAIYKWSGKGEVIKKDPYGRWDYRSNAYKGPGSATEPCWNDTYQWLPANIAFQENGTLKFTSYINNLHPQRYPGMYGTIEKMIEMALPAWDQCLVPAVAYPSRDEDSSGGAGRHCSRFEVPEDPNDHNPKNWIPSDPKEVEGLAHISVDGHKDDPESLSRCISDLDEQAAQEKRWHLLRKARIPEATFEDVDYLPEEGTRICDKFRETGLQVIVKMVSIELTPEKPDFSAGAWHVEGQGNERICATALYYVDCENVTTSSLSFRTRTDDELGQNLNIEQSSESWLEQIWGTDLSDGTCLQNYGSVETRQGRLLAFPNTFQHRVSPFSLVDKTRPGHRRFIALWLVDPHIRIISTANVPPQQQNWWLGSVFGETAESRDKITAQLPSGIAMLMQQMSKNDEILAKGEIDKIKHGQLPPELMEMVWEYFIDTPEDTLMSEEEAKEHRIKLMENRTAFVDKSHIEWQESFYNFCEH